MVLAVSSQDKVEGDEEQRPTWFEREEWINQPEWHYESLCHNEVCTAIWEPVCGCTCDGIYCRTFANECNLRVYNCRNTPGMSLPTRIASEPTILRPAASKAVRYLCTSLQVLVFYRKSCDSYDATHQEFLSCEKALRRHQVWMRRGVCPAHRSSPPLSAFVTVATTSHSSTTSIGLTRAECISLTNSTRQTRTVT